MAALPPAEGGPLPLRVCRDLDSLAPTQFRRPAVTVGVFDGVHLGHQAVLSRLVSLAAERSGEALVVTFDIHPMAAIVGAPPEPLLSTSARLERLADAGVDAVVLLSFDAEMRMMPFATFVENVLVKRLGVAALLFGYNSNFGHGGLGNARTVAPLGKTFGFVVEEAPPLLLDGRPISSTRIRDAIRTGQLGEAARLLGRPASAVGRVVRGTGRGRTIGIPTANIDVGNVLLPPEGVYEVRFRVGSETMPAVANLGRRPTVETPPALAGPTLEVHIPKFDGVLYDKEVEVEFLRRIRDERRFASLAELVSQIRRDIASIE